jgi:translation initiation factor 1
MTKKPSDMGREIDKPENSGRVKIRRTTAGSGGKTVTLVTGFIGIGLPEKKQLTK